MSIREVRQLSAPVPQPFPGEKDEGYQYEIRHVQECLSRGLKEFGARAVEKVRDARFDYDAWVRRQEPSPSLVGYQKNLWMKRSPVLSVILTSPEAGSMEEAAHRDLQEGRAARDRAATIASVQASTYGKYQFTDTLNSQISDDDFLIVIREGDLVTRDAFFEIVKALQDGADAVYTDEDSYREVQAGPGGADPDGGKIFSSPLFKPDYSPEYLRSMNYVGYLFAVRAGIVRSFYAGTDRDMAKDLFFPKPDTRSLKEQGKKRPDWELVPSAWSLADEPAYYDFVLRCCESAAAQGGVRHVPKILCHGKERGTSMISPARLRRVLEQDLERTGTRAFIEGGPSMRSFHVRRDPLGSPLVSIIIPSRDNVEMLSSCVSSRECRDRENVRIHPRSDQSISPENKDRPRQPHPQQSGSLHGRSASASPCPPSLPLSPKAH